MNSLGKYVLTKTQKIGGDGVLYGSKSGDLPEKRYDGNFPESGGKAD